MDEEKPKKVLVWEGGGYVGFVSFKDEKGFRDLRAAIDGWTGVLRLEV